MDVKELIDIANKVICDVNELQNSMFHSRLYDYFTSENLPDKVPQDNEINKLLVQWLPQMLNIENVMINFKIALRNIAYTLPDEIIKATNQTEANPAEDNPAEEKQAETKAEEKPAKKKAK